MATSALSLATSRTTVQAPPMAVVGSAASATVYAPTLAFVPPPAAGSSSSSSVVRLSTMPGVGTTDTVPVVKSLPPV